MSPIDLGYGLVTLIAIGTTAYHLRPEPRRFSSPPDIERAEMLGAAITTLIALAVLWLLVPTP